MTPGSLLIIKKMVLLICSAFALFLCPLAETTKTCKKMKTRSLTPYYLTYWQTNGFWIYLQVYERALSWPKKKKRAKKKKNYLQRSIKFAYELAMQKPRVKHIYLANYTLPTFWGGVAGTLGGYSGRSGKKKILAGW